MSQKRRAARKQKRDGVKFVSRLKANVAKVNEHYQIMKDYTTPFLENLLLGKTTINQRAAIEVILKHRKAEIAKDETTPQEQEVSPPATQ